MQTKSLSQERLKEVLSYAPRSGIFTWRVAHPRAPVGAAAGAVDAYGYTVIRIDGVLYKAHRLAWLYTHGCWPRMHLDHINQVKSDNRLCNLREASQSQNMHNIGPRAASKSGVSGVIWRPDRRKWYAQIRIGYKMYRLGTFTDKAQAIAARREAEAKLAAQFAN